jgi:hypothetical protein
MNTISAQELLNGQFDEQFIIEKACRELERAQKCSDIFEMYDHIINFSISVSMIADWIFHLKLASKDVWKKKKLFSPTGFAYKT